jgi:hypothetical protein
MEGEEKLTTKRGTYLARNQNRPPNQHQPHSFQQNAATAINQTPQQQSTFETAARQERKNGSCHGWLQKKLRVRKMKK